MDKVAICLPPPHPTASPPSSLVSIDSFLLITSQTLERLADVSAVRHFLLTEEAAPGEEEDQEQGNERAREREHALLWFFQPRLGLTMDGERGECRVVKERMNARSSGAELREEQDEEDEEPLALEACKILYRPLAAAQDDGQPRPAAPVPNNVEPLILPRSLCLRLMAFLEASASVWLPEERRVFGVGAAAWRVGWLPKGGGCGGGA